MESKLYKKILIILHACSHAKSLTIRSIFVSYLDVQYRETVGITQLKLGEKTRNRNKHLHMYLDGIGQ